MEGQGPQVRYATKRIPINRAPMNKTIQDTQAKIPGTPEYAAEQERQAVLNAAFAPQYYSGSSSRYSGGQRRRKTKRSKTKRRKTKRSKTKRRKN